MTIFRRFFGRRSAGPGDPDPEGKRAVDELLDRYHPRASISGVDGMVVAPSQVLDNVATAMERVDIDIDTPISIEEDVVPFDELASLVQSMAMGPTLAVHVVNTAMRIMSARYPAELVHAPLPPQYDLRKLHPMPIDDLHHEIAKTIFNRRAASTADLTEADVAAELEPLKVEGQMGVFVALFYMFGTKVGAMKFRTGIE